MRIDWHDKYQWAPPTFCRRATAPIGASPETPRTWVKVLGLVKTWPRSLPGMPPPAPLAMGWPTRVAVKYRVLVVNVYTVARYTYSDSENER